MLKDYDEVFRQLSMLSREEQDAFLSAAKFVATGDVEDVGEVAVVWVSVPWSLIKADPMGTALEYAEHFRELLSAGAGGGMFGGKATFSIAGLAGDPREVWELDQVRAFCRHLFSFYPPMLFALADEDHPELCEIFPDDVTRYSAMPGRLFFTSLTAPAGSCWYRDGEGFGYYKDTAQSLRDAMVSFAAGLRH